MVPNEYIFPDKLCDSHIKIILEPSSVELHKV